MKTYTIINQEGLKYDYRRGGFVKDLAWHEGINEIFLGEVLHILKYDDPNGYYEIVEHYNG